MITTITSCNYRDIIATLNKVYSYKPFEKIINRRSNEVISLHSITEELKLPTQI